MLYDKQQTDVQAVNLWTGTSWKNEHRWLLLAITTPKQRKVLSSSSELRALSPSALHTNSHRPRSILPLGPPPCPYAVNAKQMVNTHRTLLNRL